jgi:hypothetical protein
MRSANEIDFWRGLALVSIFVNHIPGFTFERWTHRNFGLSDSAELFVFLAGWGARRLVDGATERHGLGRVILRLGARAVTLYAVQIMITMLAVALIAFAATTFQNPLLLEWNNAAAVFQDPIPTHIGLVLLTHQLGFFDILPLYVVLMLGAPALAALHHVAPNLVLPASLALWAATLMTGLNLPTWPVEGTWYFSPFAWQVVFVLGFVIAGSSPVGDLARRRRVARRVIGVPIVVLGAWLALHDVTPDPMRLPWPQLAFMFDKTFETPARLIHFLALCAVFAGGFRWVSLSTPNVSGFLSMLGRNSLNVFCVGSLLSLSAQILRFAIGHDTWSDAAILIAGVGCLGFTAWVSELRERLREAEASPLRRS